MGVEDNFGNRSALAERKSKWLSATTHVSFIPDGKYLSCSIASNFSVTRIFNRLGYKKNCHSERSEESENILMVYRFFANAQNDKLFVEDKYPIISSESHRCYLSGSASACPDKR